MIDFGTAPNVRLKKTECSKPRGKTQWLRRRFLSGDNGI
jgi:hypothetical protein